MRLRVLRIGNTAIYLHLGSLLFALYMLAVGQGSLLLIGSVSILLHEGAHAVASAAAGHPPQEIELSPLGAVMRLDADAALSSGWQWIVLLAGPAMTLLMCSLAIVMTQWQWLTLTTGRTLFLCNLALLMMNLLPALPLDGGRMLALLLGSWLKPVTVNTIMRAVSTSIGLICIALNVWVTWKFGGWNLSLASAGCFIIYAGAASTITSALHELRGFMDRKIRLEQRVGMPSSTVTVLESMPLRGAVLMLHPRKHTLFCLLSQNGAHCDILPEERVIDAYLRTPGETMAMLSEK